MVAVALGSILFRVRFPSEGLGGKDMQDTDTPRRLTEDAYSDEEIQEGEIVKQSPITGKEYLVTRWVEKGDDRIIALEKEEF